jgi:hypothetical protein
MPVEGYHCFGAYYHHSYATGPWRKRLYSSKITAFYETTWHHTQGSCSPPPPQKKRERERHREEEEEERKRERKKGEISGSHSGVAQYSYLLGCYAVMTAK